jgi:hypothetical protein
MKDFKTALTIALEDVKLSGIPDTYRGMKLVRAITKQQLKRLQITMVHPNGWRKGAFKLLRFRKQGEEVTQWGAATAIPGFKDTFALYQNS